MSTDEDLRKKKKEIEKVQEKLLRRANGSEELKYNVVGCGRMSLFCSSSRMNVGKMR